MTDFERGLDAAMNDLLEFGSEVVVSAAEESSQNPAGLASKFSSGYRRFAFHHIRKVAS
jgi:hypothetical protein